VSRPTSGRIGGCHTRHGRRYPAANLAASGAAQEGDRGVRWWPADVGCGAGFTIRSDGLLRQVGLPSIRRIPEKCGTKVLVAIAITFAATLYGTPCTLPSVGLQRDLEDGNGHTETTNAIVARSFGGRGRRRLRSKMTWTGVAACFRPLLAISLNNRCPADGRNQMADLYLHDSASDFDPNAEAVIAKGLFSISDSNLIVPVDDWDDLAKEIQKHPKIDRLVLHFHAFSGGMLVGGNGRELNEKSVLDLFTKPPKVEKISFVGCHTGKAPTNMWTFAKIFSASSVSGFTWTVVWQWVNFKFPKGVTEKAARDILTPFEKLSVEMLPASKVIEATAKSGDRTANTVAMYGSSDDSTLSTLPISLQDRAHKPLKDAENRLIKPADAAKVERDLMTSPVPPFQNVTVSL
jgi:hypothetical protein